jgi:hypothetical protein
MHAMHDTHALANAGSKPNVQRVSKQPYGSSRGTHIVSPARIRPCLDAGFGQ